MRKRTATTIICVLALALLLSACELRAEHLVVVEEDGSGTVECLALLDPQEEDVDDFLDGRFADLPNVPDGWTQEAVDDGDFEGTRSKASFSDPAELETLLAALEEANEEAGGVGEPCLGLFTEGDDSLLTVDAVEARWSQQIESDPESDDELGEEISEAVAEAIDLEISVRLPGTLDSHDGVVAGDGTVTWRPTVGEAVDLHASSLLREVTNRVAGPNRYATAAAISERFFEPGVDVAFVAEGRGFADALAASGAAGTQDAPVLLTAEDDLPNETRDELARLDPGRVVILGGPAVVGPAIESALEPLAGEVDRIAGGNRYETAAAVAVEFFDDASTVYVATGRNFPDALGGGAAAAAGGHPLLLSEPDTLPASTRTQLERLAPERVVILGGQAAVDGVVESQIRGLGLAVDRISGADRYETALAVADDAFDTTGTVLVATGASAPDALAGAAAAGQTNGPVLLTRADRLPAGLSAGITALSPGDVLVLGGPAAVSNRTALELEDLLTIAGP